MLFRSVIRNKLGLLNLAQELKNVSQACKMLGYSRDTFYRYRDLVDEGGEIALHDKSRRKPNTIRQKFLSINLKDNRTYKLI